MDILTYQREAAATKSNVFYPPNNQAAIDALHAAMGACTEAGELLDQFKKVLFYGKQIDLVNLDEEIGDILWYIAIYANARGTTIEALAELNNKKLTTRFPDKFTEFHANNRDLDAERQVLEGGL
jgi:NTP pyrophosphatase (non-canonical NTP hydrolase)